MVDGGRPSPRAIARADQLAAIPREISSRSVARNAHGARRRGAGAMPPRERTTPYTECREHANAAPIVSNVSRCFHRRHTSSTCARDKRRHRFFIGNLQ
jgi:hypothetical protein